MRDYWRKLDRESDRMRLVRIGTTAEGRPMWMAIVTSPENFRKLARYQEISRRLALAEGLTDAQAHALAAEGKTVVWIDGGLHASEVLGAQQLIEMVYELVSRNDPETLRVLRDVIVLAVQANPDGQELVANWYMRENDPHRRTTAYFHNQIGLLSETIGSPTPTDIPYVPERQVPSADLPYPIAPQKWHFRQSIDYSMTANRALLDLASRDREKLLFNIYRMGKNS